MGRSNKTRLAGIILRKQRDVKGQQGQGQRKIDERETSIECKRERESKQERAYDRARATAKERKSESEDRQRELWK